MVLDGCLRVGGGGFICLLPLFGFARREEMELSGGYSVKKET